MSYSIAVIVLFAALGTLGGFLHVLVDATSWIDLKKFSSFKTIIIGTIVGIIYMFLYSDHGFPDSVMSLVSGYMGTDFIERLIAQYHKKTNNG